MFITATNDRKFRAFDAKTGKELWAAPLDLNSTAVPMTYQGKDGKQYVAVIAANGTAGPNSNWWCTRCRSQEPTNVPGLISRRLTCAS